MTTNEEFPPVIVRLSKYRTFRISVDTPPDYQPSVVLRRDTYDLSHPLILARVTKESGAA
jgi:hypothetical protein